MRTKPRQENTAASVLREQGGFEVFCPRIRFKRKTVRGPVWFEEALFPCYIFVKFDLSTELRLVSYSLNVTSILRFGDHIPVLPEELIAELREYAGPDEVREIRPEFYTGDRVLISEGPLKGLVLPVSRVLPSEERLAVLFEVLGNFTEVELDYSAVSKECTPREELACR